MERTTKNMSSFFETSLDIAEEVYARIQNDFENITEDKFNDELYDILYEEIDGSVNRMYDNKVDSLLTEIGFREVIDTYISEFGPIERGIDVRTLLFVYIKNELNNKMSFENFVEFTKGNMIF